MRKEMRWNLYRTVVLTVSDRSAQGIREDQSGPEAVRMLDEAGYQKVDIEVDGGIYQSNVAEILDAGANVIVSGSGVFKGDIRKNTEEFMEILKRYE